MLEEPRADRAGRGKRESTEHRHGIPPSLAVIFGSLRELASVFPSLWLISGFFYAHCRTRPLQAAPTASQRSRGAHVPPPVSRRENLIGPTLRVYPKSNQLGPGDRTQAVPIPCAPFLPIGTMEADSPEEGVRLFSYHSGSGNLSLSQTNPRIGVLVCLVSRFLEDFAPETSFFLFRIFSFALLCLHTQPWCETVVSPRWC